ncbi:MAG: B12-binding domain-containing radical SAM protein, partial [Bacillota bacterium]
SFEGEKEKKGEAVLKGVLEEFRPEMVGVTALTPEVYAAREVVRAVKGFSKEIFTVVGGHHASLLPEDFDIPEVDAIAVGEGEVVFPGLVEAVAGRGKLREVPNLIWRDGEGRMVHNRMMEAGLSMDGLPIAARELTGKYRDQYFFLFHRPDTSVATARGCPYRCNFCSVWKFNHGRTRRMSAGRVLEELRTVRTEHVTFVDDNFLIDWKREDAIAERIRAEGLRMQFSMECRTDAIVRRPELIKKWVEIGLVGVLLGLEGVSDQTLSRVNKSNTAAVNSRAIEILHEHNVMIWGAFIVDPDWGKDDFARLRDYVREKGIVITQFTVLTPLPGTELYRERFGDLLTHDYSCYDTMHAVVPTRLPREEFYRQFAGLYQQQDLGPYYELVRAGRMTVEDCRRGKAMLDAMGRWERFLEKDPVLGKCWGEEMGRRMPKR